MTDYSPIFLDNHPVDEWKPSKNYVPPAFFDNNFNERIRNIVPASEFKKVNPVSQAANIATAYENYTPQRYWDVDHYSIGYGTPWKEGDTTISKEEARKRMFEELDAKHKNLMSYPAYASANPNAQGGLVDTFYNTGTGLGKHSPMVSKMMVNPAYIPYIIQEIPTYRKAKVGNEKIVLEGLERRRADDIRLATDPNDREYLPTFLK